MWIALGIIGVLVVFVWITYNSLVTARMRVKEAWSGIDVQLERRYDLVPNLVETVKGYAKHEKEVFENVTKARASAMSADGAEAQGQAENMLAGTLKTLFAVAEAYPELKANANFMQLQEELGDTEDKIAYARQFYNTNVLDYNTKIQVFPAVILAGMFGFKAEEFFEAEEEAKKAVKVSFSDEKKEK